MMSVIFTFCSYARTAACSSGGGVQYLGSLSFEKLVY